MKHSVKIIASAGPAPEANAKAKSIQKIVADQIFWKEVKM